MSEKKRRTDFDGLLRARDALKAAVEDAGSFDEFWSRQGLDPDDVDRIVADAWGEMKLRASLRPLPESWMKAMGLGLMYGFFLAGELASRESFEADVLGGLDELPTTEKEE